MVGNGAFWVSDGKIGYNSLTKMRIYGIILYVKPALEKLIFKRKASAPVAELADAPDLGSGVLDVKVQVLSGAPNPIG